MYFLLIARCLNNMGFASGKLKDNNELMEFSDEEIFYGKVLLQFKKCSDRLSSI